MKKTFIILFIGLVSFGSLAQNKKEIELNLGYVTGDLSNQLGVDLNFNYKYLWKVSPKFFLGASGGGSWIFSKNDNGAALFDDAFTVTISTEGRYDLSEKLFLGSNLGYGWLTADGGSGGFHYRALFGVNLNEKLAITAGFSSINLSGGDGNWWNLINVQDDFSLNRIQIGLVKKL